MVGVGTWLLVGVQVVQVWWGDVSFWVGWSEVCATGQASLRGGGRVVGGPGMVPGARFPPSVRFPSVLETGEDSLHFLAEAGLGGPGAVHFLALWPGTWS